MSSEDDIGTLLATLELDADGCARVSIPASWSQGRSTFGGLQAELMLAAMQQQLDGDGPPRPARSLQVGFVAPVGGEVVIATQLLRQGRSATFVRAELRAGDSVCATGLACFAAARESAVAISAPPPPSMRGPDGLVSLPYVEGITPAFVRDYEMRWSSGGPPGSGLEDGSFTGWIRRRDAVAVTPGVIAGLVDAWPPAPLQMLRRLGTASSLTWAIEFVADDADARSDDWWIYAVDTDHAAGGWANARARLWSRGGTLVAISQQTVALFF